MATATPKPKIGEMVHYCLGAAHAERGKCVPAHVIEVVKNTKGPDGEVVGFDAERLSTVTLQLVDPTVMDTNSQNSVKGHGREYSKERHDSTWHLPADCDR